MLSKILLGAALCGLLTTAAMAQTTAPAAAPAPAPSPAMNSHPQDGFKHLTPADMAALVNKPDVGPILGMLSDHENWLAEVIGRNGTGEVEIHEHWIDLMSVISGTATITYGGTVTGNRQTAVGEMRGGTITGGTVVEIHQGDFIQIPAGVPHLTSLAAGTNFKVLTIKVRY